MRLFIALPVSDEAKEKFMEIQKSIIAVAPKAPVKWTEKNQCHVTVEFLGETEPREVAAIEGVIAEAAKNHKPFNFSFSGLAAFPDWHSPNVLALSLEDYSGAIKFQNELNRRLAAAGIIQNNRPWKPHLTFGRVKEPGYRFPDLRHINVAPIRWTAGKVELIESTLGARGPKYETVATVNLSV